MVGILKVKLEISAINFLLLKRKKINECSQCNEFHRFRFYFEMTF